MEFIKLTQLRGKPTAIRVSDIVSIMELEDTEEPTETLISCGRGRDYNHVRETVGEILGMLEGRGSIQAEAEERLATEEEYEEHEGEYAERQIFGEKRPAGEDDSRHAYAQRIHGEMTVENSSGRAAEAGEGLTAEEEVALYEKQRDKDDGDSEAWCRVERARMEALGAAIECVHGAKRASIWPAADRVLNEILDDLRKLRSEVPETDAERAKRIEREVNLG